MTKTMRRAIGVGGIWCWLAMGGGAAFAGSNWLLLDQEEGQSDFYYDKAAIVRGDADLLKIQVKVVYGPDGKAEALDLLGNAKLYGPLAATYYRYDINCATGQSRLTEVSHRDGGDKVLREFNLTGKTGWEEIPVGSRLEMVSEAECPAAGK